MNTQEDKFEFKEVDAEGEETLDVIRYADKFNAWMYKTIRPYCTGNILEIGSGLGNISQFFLADEVLITLTDVRSNYCKHLQERFGLFPSLQKICLMDLTDDAFDTKFKHLFDSFDCVFALNVVEHIYNDELAVANCKKLLKKGGNLLILVPSYSFLFNDIDRSLEHYRRYNKKSLSLLFSKNELPIVQSFYFNFMGIFAWFVSGKLQGNKTIPKGQMKLYNLFVPLFRVIDKLTFKKWGLSTIVVGNK